MLVYMYNNDKKFIGSRMAQIDPVQTKKQGKEIYLMPANATIVPPLASKDGFYIVWNGLSWEYQEKPKPQEPEPYVPTEEDLKRNRMGEIQARLNELSQDFIQASIGAIIVDLEDRKTEFKTLHNELRTLLEKEPRQYI